MRVTQVPENITLEQAATVPLGLATVTTGIWARGPGARSVSIPAPWEEGGETQNAGKPILVLGGTSNVGQYGTSPCPVLRGRLPLVLPLTLTNTRI